MLVSRAMSRRVVAVAPDDTVARAATLMARGGFRHLPVVQRERLVGIVSDRDLRGASATRVAEVMTRRPIAVSPDASVDEAACVMDEHTISALPVVTAGKVVGILTTTEVLRAFVELSGAAAPSTRIVLSPGGERLPDRRIREIVQACRGELKWIHRHGRHRHLRVLGRDVAGIVTALEAAGVDVAAVVASAPRRAPRPRAA